MGKFDSVSLIGGSVGLGFARQMILSTLASLCGCFGRWERLSGRRRGTKAHVASHSALMTLACATRVAFQEVNLWPQCSISWSPCVLESEAGDVRCV